MENFVGYDLIFVGFSVILGKFERELEKTAYDVKLKLLMLYSYPWIPQY